MASAASARRLVHGAIPPTARRQQVSSRTVSGWRAGAQPNAQHLLALVRFAKTVGLLDQLIGADDGDDERQGVLFEVDEWRRLGGGGRTGAARASVADQSGEMGRG